MNSQQMMEEIDRLARLCAAKDAETEPLRREVAMLRSVLSEYLNYTRGNSVAINFGARLQDSVSDTQATALAYEREVKAKALEKLVSGLSDEETVSAFYVRRKIAELRASNKGEGK